MFDPRAIQLAKKYERNPIACKTDIVQFIADDLKVATSTVYLWLRKHKFKINK